MTRPARDGLIIAAFVSTGFFYSLVYIGIGRLGDFRGFESGVFKFELFKEFIMRERGGENPIAPWEFQLKNASLLSGGVMSCVRNPGESLEVAGLIVRLVKLRGTD